MTNEEWKVQTNLVCARGMGVFFFFLERSLYLLRTSVRSYREIYQVVFFFFFSILLNLCSDNAQNRL